MWHDILELILSVIDLIATVFEKPKRKEPEL